MSAATLVIGTGFLGRAIVLEQSRRGRNVRHTYRSKAFFPDSIRYDLLLHDLAGVVDVTAVRCVVVAVKFPDSSDPGLVTSAMRGMLRACAGKRVLFVSSDAVFDGSKGSYSESGQPNPRTGHGRIMLACEKLVSSIVPDHCILRTSYIYGHSAGMLDDRLASARVSARQGFPLGRFIDMYKSPVDVNLLARIIAVLVDSRHRGVFHAGGERLSVFDFTRRSLAALGENSRLIVPEEMPIPTPHDMLADTSLDGRMLARLLGIGPTTIESALAACTGSGSERHASGADHVGAAP